MTEQEKMAKEEKTKGTNQATYRSGCVPMLFV